MSESRDLAQLEARLGHEFADSRWLDEALTHRSRANEAQLADNERLEFLGDAVVGLVVADELMRRFPAATEGQLSATRASIVSATGLATAARRFDLGRWLRVGRGEAAHGGSQKSSLLANAFEAVLGAVYRDAGFAKAQEVARELLAEDLASADVHEVRDFKTTLQERYQAERGVAPKYEIVSEEGPPHERVFVARVSVGDEELGRGQGRSKKAAEQAAAKVALSSL